LSRRGLIDDVTFDDHQDRPRTTTFCVSHHDDA
jgi:hypothetical protein